MLLFRDEPFVPDGCGVTVSVLARFAAEFSSPSGTGRLVVGGGVSIRGLGWLKLGCRGTGVTLLGAAGSAAGVEMDGRGVPAPFVLILIDPVLGGAAGRAGSAGAEGAEGGGSDGAIGALGFVL